MVDRRQDDPIGYTYKAEEVCDVCILAVMNRSGHTIPLPVKSTVWNMLQVHAVVLGIDVEDGSTYDSGDFPKPIWPWQETKEVCSLCREPLDEEQFNFGRWLP